MRNIMICRRTFVTVLGIAACTALGILNNLDVSLALAGMVASICGANAWEGAKGKSGPDKFVGGA